MPDTILVRKDASRKSRGTILVVEDEPSLRRAYARILEGAGFWVFQAADGQEATRALAQQEFDAVLSDIAMPGMDGLQLLRHIRERDQDLPVVLITAFPAMESAIQAVEHGALRYLLKPVERADLVAAVDKASKLCRVGRIKRELTRHLESRGYQFQDRAALEASLDRYLAAMWVAFQPIVSWRDQKIIAFEALVRSDDPSLPNPGAMLSLAEQLGRLHQVGRLVRARVGDQLRADPGEHLAFVNLHPYDLQDDELFSPKTPLAASARRVVLEITERSSLDEHDGIQGKIAHLREMGFRIAVDDLGAGYSGLNYFSLLAPEVVKLDMVLTRGIHLDPLKRRLVTSLASLCADLEMKVVAEGVETQEERDTLLEIGCDYLQGYLFARPGRAYPAVKW